MSHRNISSHTHFDLMTELNDETEACAVGVSVVMLQNMLMNDTVKWRCVSNSSQRATCNKCDHLEPILLVHYLTLYQPFFHSAQLLYIDNQHTSCSQSIG